MEVSYCSEVSPEHPVNEDLVLAGPDFVVVLDGATPAPGLETGCVHDVPWYVRTLGSHLVALLAGDDPLGAVLTHAIELTCADHTDTCDLTNPDSPSSTVAMVRVRDDVLEHLVLADSTVVVRGHDGTLAVHTDDRLDHLPDYSRASVSRLRNTDEGFWAASTRPEAGGAAYVGSVPVGQVAEVALLTDGAATLVERHGRPWAETLGILREHGPRRLLAMVREADESGPPPVRAKRHDDATAVLCRLAVRT